MDKTKMAIDVFNKYANVYQQKYMNVDLYGDTFDLFCRHLPTQNAQVLDLACGPGNITRYLLEKRPDLKILGIDLAPNMIDLAKANNPTAEFQLMDCRNILELNKKYEGIMAGFCLPYLSKSETEKLIRDAALLLNSGGVIYLSTMEDDYEKSGLKGPSSADARPEDVLFMHYHQADYLTAALLQNDFSIIDLQRKIYPAPDGSTTTDLVIIASR